jgi:hypothetical protein
VRVGITVRKGSDDLETFYVRVEFDGGSDIETINAIPISSGDFSYEKLIVTRDQAGSEKWIFGVQETDGDTYNRSVLLVVQ